MLSAALRYPFATRDGRDGLAVCVGLVVAMLLLVRVAMALWPAWTALLPAGLVVVPTLLFAGYLGTVLRADVETATPPRFQWSGATVRGGATTLALGSVYVLPAVVALLVTVFVLLETGATPGRSPLVAIAPTVALFALAGAAYVLPAGVATGLSGGVRAGLSRSALGGLSSGGYFFAWTLSMSVLVVSWGVVGAIGVQSPLAVLGAVVAAYGSVVATRLLAQGLARSRWEPPG